MAPGPQKGEGEGGGGLQGKGARPGRFFEVCMPGDQSMFVAPSGRGVEGEERSARQTQKEKRDFSLRRPTFSRERKRRKKIALPRSKLRWVGLAPTRLAHLLFPFP